MTWHFQREQIPGGCAPTSVLLLTGTYLSEEELNARINPTAYLGWLSPQGVLYGCGYGAHNYLEASISKHIQEEPERHGWIALTVSIADKLPEWGWPLQTATEAQEKAIIDWCLYYDIELPDFLKPDIDYTLVVPEDMV